MRFIFNLIGELDLWGEKTGKFLGLLMCHITMSSLTGGLWLFWLAYKFYRNIKRKRGTRYGKNDM